MGAALLVYAAADGDASKVAELLSQGARVDAREHGTSTTIHTAIIHFMPIFLLQKRSLKLRMGAALVYAAADGDAS